MAEKRYLWLKLSDGFFRDKVIKKLRRLAGGDTYTIIYLEMLLLAMNNNNCITFDGVEDDFASEIALELDEDVENVQMTLAYLLKNGLVEEIGEKEYELTRCKQMVGSESASARRVRKHRDNVKTLQCNADVTAGNAIETNCNTEKSRVEKSREDIEKEKSRVDIEKELEKEKIYNNNDNNYECSENETYKNEMISEDDKLRFFGEAQVVMLSENQVEDLLEKLTLQEFDYYVDKLGSFIVRKDAVVSSHYKTILKWVQEDRKVKV